MKPLINLYFLFPHLQSLLERLSRGGAALIQLNQVLLASLFTEDFDVLLVDPGHLDPVSIPA